MYHNIKQYNDSCARVKSTANLNHGKFTLNRILYLKNNELRVTTIYKESSTNKLWQKKIYQYTHQFNNTINIAITDIENINIDMLNSLISENKPKVLS